VFAETDDSDEDALLVTRAARGADMHPYAREDAHEAKEQHTCCPAVLITVDDPASTGCPAVLITVDDPASIVLQVLPAAPTRAREYRIERAATRYGASNAPQRVTARFPLSVARRNALRRVGRAATRGVAGGGGRLGGGERRGLGILKTRGLRRRLQRRWAPGRGRARCP
jgi:hypothetical protein